MLLIYCLMYLPLFVGVLCSALFILNALNSLAIILTRKRELVTVNVLWFFLTVPGMVLQFVYMW